MFEKEGYDIVTKSKNHIINRASQLRNEAEDWLPVWFLRDYRYDSQNFITTEILLSNSSKSGRETKINQSFFLATKYKFKKRLKIDDWEYWSETSQDYYFYCKFSNKENKKRLKKQGWEEKEFKMVYELKFIVIPLFELKNRNSIKKEILNKLL